MSTYSEHEIDWLGQWRKARDRAIRLRTQVEAMMRVLLDSGDMTPMAVRQITAVFDEREAG